MDLHHLFKLKAFRPTRYGTNLPLQIHLPIYPYTCPYSCSDEHSFSREYTMHNPHSELRWYLDLAWGKHTTTAPKLHLESHASFEIPAQMFFHEHFSNSFPQNITPPTTVLTTVILYLCLSYTNNKKCFYLCSTYWVSNKCYTCRW